MDAKAFLTRMDVLSKDGVMAFCEIEEERAGVEHTGHEETREGSAQDGNEGQVDVRVLEVDQDATVNESISNVVFHLSIPVTRS